MGMGCAGEFFLALCWGMEGIS